MKLILFVFAAVPFLLFVAGHEDYCNPQLCRKDTHVACQPAVFRSTCPDNGSPVLLSLGGDLRTLVVDTHNQYRSQVALGQLAGFESATNMSQIVWDDDLAYVAGFNVRGCEMKHDKCRSTTAYPHSGQNLATRYSIDGYQDVNESIAAMVALWFNEYPRCDQSVIDSYRSQTGGDYGHFTELVQQRNGHVGCAIVQYQDDIGFHTLMACNYEYTNMKNEAVYTSGQSCSDCNGNCDANGNGLCQH